MNTLTLSVRNAFRNKRRSFFTVLTIVIGAVALSIFGGFVNSVYQGIEVGVIRSSGHLHVHKQGFFEFGSGRLTEFDIADYDRLISTIREDSVLKPLLRVVTPTLTLGGIAGNYVAGSSQAFIGAGMVAADQAVMRQWLADRLPVDEEPMLLQPDGDAAVMATGLAKILSFCDELAVPDCQDQEMPASADAEVDPLLLGLAEDNPSLTTSDDVAVELMASSAQGAPNVIRLPLLAAQEYPDKSLNDRLIQMPLSAAQRLVYGNSEPRISTVVIQLQHSADVAFAKDRLEALFSEQELPMEVLTVNEFFPSFSRIINMFKTIFGFITFVIVLVVLFTIVNNLSMSVVERYREIGTLRALGVSRKSVAAQFFYEGTFLGLLGASLGLLAGVLVTALINRAGIFWTPPSNTSDIQLVLDLFLDPRMPLMIWVTLLVATALASLPPSIRATRMPVIEALRHI